MVITIILIKGWSLSSKRYKKTKSIFTFSTKLQESNAMSKETWSCYRKVNKVDLEFILSPEGHKDYLTVY